MVNYNKLTELHNERLRFRATVEEVEYGKTHVRISNISLVSTGEEVCTYMRLRYCKNFKELELETDEVIEFDARVVMRMNYGRPMKSIRYKLDKPTKCAKV